MDSRNPYSYSPRVSLPIKIDTLDRGEPHEVDRQRLLTGVDADGVRVALAGPLPTRSFSSCAVNFVQVLDGDGQPYGPPTAIEAVFEYHERLVVDRKTHCRIRGHWNDEGRCWFCQELITSVVFDEDDPTSIDYGAAARELRDIHRHIERRIGAVKGFDGQWGFPVETMDGVEWDELGGPIEAIERIAQDEALGEYYRALHERERLVEVARILHGDEDLERKLELICTAIAGAEILEHAVTCGTLPAEALPQVGEAV